MIFGVHALIKVRGHMFMRESTQGVSGMGSVGPFYVFTDLCSASDYSNLVLRLSFSSLD